MKRMVKAIQNDKKQQDQEERRQNEELAEIKNTYSEIASKSTNTEDDKNNQHLCEKENLKPNKSRTNHPDQKESPLSKIKKKGEGRAV